MNKEYKACFVIPYFGKFPNYFSYFLSSAIYNSKFDFLFVTDIDYKFPEVRNIKVVNMSFQELQKKIQSVFDFKININVPYKLCDYKPAYGVIFKDYLNEYDYWGHCDIDTILGDLNHYIPFEELQEYDRIFTEGHMTLYKNNDKVNNYFRTLSAKDCQNYKDVYTTDDVRCFDEWGAHKGNGLSWILEKNGIKQYKESMCFDVNSTKYKFLNARNKEMYNGYFEYTHGKVIFWKYENKQYIPEEVSYVHFQKRKLKIESTNTKHFYVVQPNVIKDSIHLDKPLNRIYSIQWNIYWQQVNRKFGYLKKRLMK